MTSWPKPRRPNATVSPRTGPEHLRPRCVDRAGGGGHHRAAYRIGHSGGADVPRHPHAIAQQAHTVAAVSGNRLTLGIGLSHKVVIENMFGLSYAAGPPPARIPECPDAVVPQRARQLRRRDVPGARRNQRQGFDRLGVVVAALGEQMLRVTAALADGTLTWCTGPATCLVTPSRRSPGRPRNSVGRNHGLSPRCRCA